MITIQLTKSPCWQQPSEAYIIFCDDKLASVTPTAPLSTIEQENSALIEILKRNRFEGKCGQSFAFTGTLNAKLATIIFIGLGALKRGHHHELESLRRGLCTALQTLKKLRLKTACIALPESTLYGLTSAQLLHHVVIATHMSTYDFIDFKPEALKDPWTVTLLMATENTADAATALETANLIGQTINKARRWADSPANVMTPTVLSEEAKKIAIAHNLKHTIFGREKALELGMGGFCAVDAGSDQDGKFVVLEYKTTVANAPTIALCGKGVHFDTGGINIKPTSGISGMKFDMSGAASVIAMMGLFGQLKPAINIIGLTPLVENMPSGKASRPDDIITCMNGKTVEIRNTDAEGRLILSDTLCYAEKFYSPDIIIDIATLTGAVQHGLGHFYTAVLTKDDQLASALLAIGKATGDRTWQLPLDDDFKEAIKTDVADIHNNGSSAYYGGTIVGACFLQNFVEKSRWVHLDIAGTAHDVPGINYVGKGATGASIRLLTEFLLNYGQYKD